MMSKAPTTPFSVSRLKTCFLINTTSLTLRLLCHADRLISQKNVFRFRFSLYPHICLDCAVPSGWNALPITLCRLTFTSQKITSCRRPSLITQTHQLLTPAPYSEMDFLSSAWLPPQPWICSLIEGPVHLKNTETAESPKEQRGVLFQTSM